MRKEKRKPSERVRIATYLLIIVLASILFYFLTFRGMRFFMVPSASMEPTLLPFDHIITLEEEHYNRGDVVVIMDVGADDEYLVKRIVGVPGDTVEVEGGVLFLNGAYASEPYLSKPMYYEFGPLTIPQGQVFLLGDNRNDSDDSHVRGQTFLLQTIVGKVLYIYLPPSRIGPVRSFPLKNVNGE